MKEEILKLRGKGLTYKEIKDELGCSKSTISYHCSKKDFNEDIRKKNVENKNKKQKKKKSFLIEDYNVDEVIKLRKDKKRYSEISKILNIPYNSVSKICRMYGLVNSRKYGSINEYEIKKIKERYNELKSIKEVTKELGYSYQTIRKHINLIVNNLTEEEKKKKKSEHVISWRQRAKLKLVDYKGGECERCGYNKCMKVLGFHHLDPNEKDFNISGKSWSFEKLKKEVDKCILVCANCHIEIHDEI